MAIHWLHLSDIHFHAKGAWRDARVQGMLINYLREMFASGEFAKPDLIFCTGDIAFGETKGHPLADQYATAQNFFDQLLAVCGLGKTRLFLVPGNHDVDRNAVDEDAQTRLVEMAGDDVARTHVRQINSRLETRPTPFLNAMKRLAAYETFIENYLPHQHDKAGRCIHATTLEIDGRKVGIAGFNSAWSTAGDTDDRRLWLGAEWQFNRVQKTVGDADIRIGLIHHPTDWFNVADRDVATRRIAGDFDVWLHGHSHNAWVEASGNHILIGAGAVGAETTDEFGVNLVKLPVGGALDEKGEVHLHQFNGGWTIHPIAQHAPRGVWRFDLPSRLRGRGQAGAVQQGEISPVVEPPPLENTTVLEATPPMLPEQLAVIVQPAEPTKPPEAAKSPKSPEAHAPLGPMRRPLYGRSELLKQCATKLTQRPVLLAYGLRGNGKSALIDELANLSPLAGRERIRWRASASASPLDLFNALAWYLGEQSENPTPPSGDAKAIAAALQKKYGQPARAAWLHIDNAHTLLSGSGFIDLGLRHFLLGLQQAFGAALPVVLELRERPASGLLAQAAHEIEIPGLDKSAVGEMLLGSAPEGADWRYSGDELKRIYSWLGAGHGKTAHPLTLTLLVEVAKGLGQTPREVLNRHSDQLERALEDKLLGDLYRNVLNADEQTLFETLALYRIPVPHDHIDWLESKLRVDNGWDGLYRRMLLSSDSKGSEFYLHGFMVAWLRRQQGYAVADEDAELVFAAEVEELHKAKINERHLAVAECWLQQLGGGKRRSQLNFERALEAFHHLLAGGDGDRIHGIAVDLLSGKLDWALKKITQFNDHLRKTHAPLEARIKVLEYWLKLDPQEPRAWRFLGEKLAKVGHVRDARVLECFEKASALNPDHPPHWTNLGRALLAQGPDGARAFLQRLETLERERPHAIDDYVIAVRADCLTAVGELAAAHALRRKQIDLGSDNPVFYNDEAKALFAEGRADDALAMLALARSRNFVNKISAAIETDILQKTGQAGRAQALRMARIDAGDLHPADYTDEAHARLKAGRPAAALAMLDLAQQRGVDNAHAESIRAQALDAAGRHDEALALRAARIDARSRNPVFYNTQADALAKQGNLAAALAVLDAADKLNIGNEYTERTRRRILAQMQCAP